MSMLEQLVRPEVRALDPYRSAQFEAGLVRLNANETPWRPPGDDSADGLNRYPEPYPFTLTARLATHYGVAPEQLLVTRGSSEAIDFLVRCFCRAGQDQVMICPPTFGMYAHYAQVQGAGVVRVPLRRDAGYLPDPDAIATAWTEQARLLFLCSPANPVGNVIPAAMLRDLAGRLGNRGILVLDAAYVEFAESDPTLDLLREFPNVVVLRTLSKAMGLAAARCGAALGSVEVIGMLRRLAPPYSFSTPCQSAVLACFTDAARSGQAEHRRILLAERQRLADALARHTEVRRVWPSETNFVLVEVADAPAFTARARAGGILLRDFSWDPDLPGCVRITIGTPAENDRLLSVLGVAP
jgi:histidinol-phosphate aminotransferase